MRVQVPLPFSVRAGGIGAKRLIRFSVIALFGLAPAIAATAVAAAGPRPPLATHNISGKVSISRALELRVSTFD